MTGDADRRSADDAAEADSLVDARGVTVGYGSGPVLSGVSLSVERGELVGLVGPNGAGKTTLLKAINGVLDPDEGRVLVDGDDVHDLSSRAASRRVATVPQDTTVAFEFPVEAVVEMGRTPYHGRVRRDPDAAEAVERALDRTETTRFRDRTVGSLSGGERQRVVLARALAQGTPALVLDEPTASLDINHQVRTLALVRELTREGRGALAAIHDLDLAARFCDRIAVLADGNLQAVGPPETVLTGERVAAAFDTAAAVVPSPVTGTPTVTPLSDASADGKRPGRLVESDPCVHVAGTGRTAARAVAALSAAGATVTAGVFPAEGLAAGVAREHGVDPVVAPPFAPLDAEAEASAREQLGGADVAVLAGRAPPSVRALVRDHDAVVRVTDPGAGTDPGGDASTVATASPATVVETVARVEGSRLPADD
jgi:iron complex transport system ATP-binding protein